MTWTPGAPPRTTWAKDTQPTATWAPSAPPFATWNIAGFDQQRVTESGARRVIEQAAVVRIIERYRVDWNLDAPPSAVWTEGEAHAEAT